MTEFDAESIIESIETHGRDGRQRIEASDDALLAAHLCAALTRAKNPKTRQIICEILASVADPSALPCLLAGLSDPDDGVVAAAADAVGNSSYEQQIPDPLRRPLGERLLAIATDLDRPGPRAAAVYGLGLMRHHPAFRPLLPMLEDPDPMIRWSAAEALAHIGDTAAEPYIRQRRGREEDERVRRRLTDALELLAERRSGEPNP